MSSVTTQPRTPSPAARLLLPLTGVVLAVHTVLLLLPLLAGTDATGYLSPRNPVPVLLEVALVAAVGLVIGLDHRLRGSAMVRGSAVAVAVVMVLGLVSYAPCEGGAARGITSFVWSLKLFIGEFEAPFGDPSSGPACPADPPVAIQAAQVIAMGVVLASVATVVRELFRHDWDRLRIRRARRLVLVVDSGVETAEYLTWLQGRHASVDDDVRTLVAVTAPEGTHDHADAPARRDGAVHLAADSTSDTILPLVARRGRTRLAELHLLSPNARANRRLLAHLRHRFTDLETPDHIDAVIRIDDPWEAEEWRRRHLGDDGPWVLDAVGVHETTARAILTHARDYGSRTVVAVGTSPLVIALAHEHASHLREAERIRLILESEAAARRTHTPPADIIASTRVPRLVVVGEHAEELLRQHRLQQARYGLTPSDATSHPTPGPASAADVDAATTGADDVVVVIADEGVAPLTAHGVTLHHPSWPVLVHDPRAIGMESRALEPGITRFSPTLELGAEDTVTTRERLARLVHNTYRARFGTEAQEGSMASWDVLAHFFRESNLRQVSTLLENATHAGLQWSAPASDEARAAREAGYEPEGWRLLLLAMAEHESWRNAYVAAGWRQGEVRDDAKKIRVDLLPWVALRMDGRRRAIAGVRAALGALRSAGYVLSPADDADPVPADWETPGWLLIRQTGTVRAEQLTEPWTWTLRTPGSGTQEMRAEPGDWRVSDGTEAWSVKPDAFARDHAPTAHPGVYERRGLRLARPVVPGGESVLSAEDETAAPGRPAPTAAPGRWILADELGNVWHSDPDALRARHIVVGRPHQPGGTS